MKKRVLKLLTLSVCLLILYASSVMAEDPVYFADANLKAAVESELGISDPTPTDMLSLTVLDAYYSEISDLTGIEYATNLNKLDLYGNQISDISAVSGLTNLTRLGLSWNQISDFLPLSGLTNLRDLGLRSSQISDITTLEGLTSLTGLALMDNQISDISAVSGLMSLTELHLGGNQISDISALSGLTNIKSLWLDYNQISDISALSGLTSLTSWLVLDSNPLNEEAYCTYLPLIEDNNPAFLILMYDPNPYPPDVCLDSDDDGLTDDIDNCPEISNPNQEDTYPPQGNGIGDACDCEADFNCDGRVDATDVTRFLTDFGRDTFLNPCSNANPCNGDFECDANVDADDVTMFIEDFGRDEFYNPCPTCTQGAWCSYP